MHVEAQQMREQLIDLRVAAALASSRLVRVDNPVLHDKLADLRAKAMRVMQEVAADAAAEAMAE